MTDTVATSQPWYRGLSRHQWNILLAANLGWLFDGFELYALFLTVGPAMRALLEPSQYPQIPAYIGTVVAITLLGWGIGGIVGGVLADYIGRKRTMILAILAYSITTGLTALSFDWMSFAILRFLVGIAIGSEWATGSSMMAELWPDHARGRGAGLMQCGIGIGNFVASFVWLYVSMLGPDSWRYLFLIGILPAVLTLWIRTSIPESNKWEQINERRKAARERQRSGTVLAAEEQALTRFTSAGAPSSRCCCRSPPRSPGGASRRGCRPTLRRSRRRRTCRRSNGPPMPAWPTISAACSATSALVSSPTGSVAGRPPCSTSAWRSS
jgi:MFS family permease